VVNYQTKGLGRRGDIRDNTKKGRGKNNPKMKHFHVKEKGRSRENGKEKKSCKNKFDQR